jgi:hypothetical protein
LLITVFFVYQTFCVSEEEGQHQGIGFAGIRSLHGYVQHTYFISVLLLLGRHVGGILQLKRLTNRYNNDMYPGQEMSRSENNKQDGCRVKRISEVETK